MDRFMCVFNKMMLIWYVYVRCVLILLFVSIYMSSTSVYLSWSKGPFFLALVF